jgi:thiamine pyrophosphate-dependent acetolactate synthase large subunit-like protein
MNEADLLVVMGASFSNHTGITPKIPTIQVDADPMALGRFHPVDVPVQGDIAVTARLLFDALDEADPPEDRRPEIARRWAMWRAEKARREADDRGRGLSAASVFAAMSRLVPEDAVIAVDVGNNTHSFGRYFECSRQSVLMSGYLGSIGLGYPAAMGAWCAAPELMIVCVTGDGGFGQYLGELTTAVKSGMPITHVLLNNGELGKISKEQRAGMCDVWETRLHNPGFAAYAELCGAQGIRVNGRDELKPALARALAHDGPSLVEVVQDPELV